MSSSRGVHYRNQPEWLITADVNGDGKLDLVTTGGPGAVFIWLGNGDGTFQLSPNSYTTGTTPVMVVAGDLNADGKLNLAVVNANANMVSVFLGHGDGTFQNKVDFPASLGGISSTPISLAIGDFNGDGGMDLAVQNQNLAAGFNLNLTTLLQGTFPTAAAIPPTLTFGRQSVGTTSPAQIVTLTSTGIATLTLSGIGMTGVNAGDFAQTNTCGSTLAVNATCQISVTFTPTEAGNRTAAVSVTDNGPGSPQLISVMGSSPAAVASIFPSDVSFESQYVGTSGLPQSVTVTNTGTANLTFTSVSASPSDFGVVNNCLNALTPGTSCGIAVFFDPTVSGTRNGALTITDNAGNSPQTVGLTGTGQDFSLSPSSPNATITVGQTATYTISVNPRGGFYQAVALSCSGAPPQSTCSLSSNSVTLNGSRGVTVTATVTTAGNSAGLTNPPALTPASNGRLAATWPGLLGSLGLAVLGSFGSWSRNRNRRLLCLLTSVCLLSVGMPWTGCGGGSSSGTSNGGTPVGTYNLTVTGAFASGSTALTHSARLTLVVQ